MNWIIPVAQVIIGISLACGMQIAIDRLDDVSGRRPGAARDGYGSDISFGWRNVIAGLGFLMVLTSPFTFALVR
jgi:hypothetical protein